MFVQMHKATHQSVVRYSLLLGSKLILCYFLIWRRSRRKSFWSFAYCSLGSYPSIMLASLHAARTVTSRWSSKGENPLNFWTKERYFPFLIPSISSLKIALYSVKIASNAGSTYSIRSRSLLRFMMISTNEST